MKALGNSKKSIVGVVMAVTELANLGWTLY
jgi:hypothetical protein